MSFLGGWDPFLVFLIGAFTLAMAGLGLFFVKPEFAMMTFGIALPQILLGGVWALVKAFQESVLCGLAYLFVPFYGIYYILTRLDELQRPVLLWGNGMLIAAIMVGVMKLAIFMEENAKNRPQGGPSPVARENAPRENPSREPPPPGEPGSAAPGLRAYWSFDEGEGDTAVDNSPLKLKAKLHGCTWVPGVRGKAIYLDGKAHVDLGASPALTLAEKAPLTVAGWVKADPPRNMEPIRGHLLSFRNDPDTMDLFDLSLDHDILLARARQRHNPHFPLDVRSQAKISDGQWHHFAATRTTDGELLLYVDGTLQEKVKGLFSGPQSGPIVTNLHTLGLEARRTVGDHFVERDQLKGCLDEVCIFGDAVSEQEIRRLAGR